MAYEMIKRCDVQWCDEEFALVLYHFTLEEGGTSEGLFLCMDHLRDALQDSVLRLTDQPPTLRHIIVATA